MPSINGVDFNSISSLNGVSWNSVADIGGVPVTHGPTCTSTPFGYSDGIRSSPYDACTAFVTNYDFDIINNLLYNPGGCGTTFAAPGFYSDGRQIFQWNGYSSFTFYDACPR